MNRIETVFIVSQRGNSGATGINQKNCWTDNQIIINNRTDPFNFYFFTQLWLFKIDLFPVRLEHKLHISTLHFGSKPAPGGPEHSALSRNNSSPEGRPMHERHKKKHFRFLCWPFKIKQPQKLPIFPEFFPIFF